MQYREVLHVTVDETRTLLHVNTRVMLEEFEPGEEAYTVQHSSAYCNPNQNRALFSYIQLAGHGSKAGLPDYHTKLVLDVGGITHWSGNAPGHVIDEVLLPAIKLFRRTQARLEKMTEEEGHPQDYPEHAARLARALNITQFRVISQSGLVPERLCYSIGGFRSHLAEVLERARGEMAPS